MLRHLLFCNSCFFIWYFVFLMQFYFIIYACSYYWKIIHHKSWYNISNKICIELMVVFWIQIKTYVCGSFNFVISNKSDFLWYPAHKYHLHLDAYMHCNWTNIEFVYWTWYSTECAMYHHLTALTNSFLLLNVCPISKSNPSGIHLWLSAQLWELV
jgi:hypothetical protein